MPVSVVNLKIVIASGSFKERETEMRLVHEVLISKPAAKEIITKKHNKKELHFYYQTSAVIAKFISFEN